MWTKSEYVPSTYMTTWCGAEVRLLDEDLGDPCSDFQSCHGSFQGDLGQPHSLPPFLRGGCVKKVEHSPARVEGAGQTDLVFPLGCC